jgi:hypothetical protein
MRRQPIPSWSSWTTRSIYRRTGNRSYTLGRLDVSCSCKAISHIIDSPPDLRTSKPSPFADFFSGSRSCARYLATVVSFSIDLPCEPDVSELTFRLLVSSGTTQRFTELTFRRPKWYSVALLARQHCHQSCGILVHFFCARHQLFVRMQCRLGLTPSHLLCASQLLSPYMQEPAAHSRCPRSCLGHPFSLMGLVVCLLCSSSIKCHSPMRS